MKKFALFMTVLLLVGCQKESEENNVREETVSDAAPFYVVVRKDDNGQQEYAYVEKQMDEDELHKEIETSRRSVRNLRWRAVSPQKQIETEYPSQSDNQKMYFVNDPTTFESEESNANYGRWHNTCHYTSGSSWVYYGYSRYYHYNRYRHCYPRYSAYWNWRYQPTFHFRRNFYYYRPVHYPIYRHRYTYWVYRAGWWW